MHRWPLLDLDPRHEDWLTLAVWIKYQRLTVGQAGGQLRKCSCDVREVSHDNGVRSGWKACHLLLQPGGLSRRVPCMLLPLSPSSAEVWGVPN